MALGWREAAERMDVYLRQQLSSGLLFLHAELGVDLGLKSELLPPGLLACVAAGLGLLLAALLWFFVCRCFSKKPAEKVAPEVGKTSKQKSEEVKKRSRKRGGDKKVQRNGVAVDLDEELKPAEARNQKQKQNQSESPDPAGGKSDKGKKNKKKTKVLVKDAKSPSTSERKEPEEVGTWVTKVSHREKRQQRRKDKEAGDESGSPGGTEPSTNASNTEHPPAVEEPKIILTPPVTSNTTKTSNAKTTNTSSTSNAKTSSNAKTTNTSTSSNAKTTNTSTSSNAKTTNTSTSPNAKTTNTSTTLNTNTSNAKTSTTPTAKTSNSSTTPNTKTSNTSTTSNSKTTSISNTKTNTSTTSTTKTSTKNTKPTNTPAPKAQKNEDPPVAEVSRAVIPPVSRAWDVMAMNGSGSWDLGVSVPPHTQTWNSAKSEPSVWPQDMEGSWMIVDGSHIPVSLHGMTAGVEVQVVPERPWACPVPVDDEWSGPNSSSADPASDYCAPCEEWGNYEEPAGGAVSPDVPQDSDPEKDKDEPVAPGSSKPKKKKKKKKKAEEAGNAAQFEVEVGVAKDQNTAGLLPKTTKEPENMVPLRVPLKTTEPEAPPKSTAPPSQKKPEESWESPKQVKKKKARRET